MKPPTIKDGFRTAMEAAYGADRIIAMPKDQYHALELFFYAGVKWCMVERTGMSNERTQLFDIAVAFELMGMDLKDNPECK